MHGNGIIFSSEDKILYEGEYKNGKYDIKGTIAEFKKVNIDIFILKLSV